MSREGLANMAENLGGGHSGRGSASAGGAPRREPNEGLYWYSTPNPSPVPPPITSCLENTVTDPGTSPGTRPRPETVQIPEITPTELRARLDREHPLVLVDVREAWEMRIADLPDVGQHRIPVAEFEGRVGELDPDAAVVVYCRSGARSAWAVRQLKERGFEQVWNLKGGVLGWREEVDPSLEAY
ncbi:MAG: hypothetical protein EA350_16010 [Gemmatimonadales bacterium]|nr:MAG: hypothetical protein EA350_16010 [Gemmatimonadales bacterium]